MILVVDNYDSFSYKYKKMSFFGLTAFGPENFVKTTLVNFGCKKH